MKELNRNTEAFLACIFETKTLEKPKIDSLGLVQVALAQFEKETPSENSLN